MAQIWITYEELAELCLCAPINARTAVKSSNWARRQCSDGRVRVKLPEDLAFDFMRAATSHVFARPVARENEDALSTIADFDRAARREEIVRPNARPLLIAPDVPSRRTA